MEIERIDSNNYNNDIQTLGGADYTLNNNIKNKNEEVITKTVIKTKERYCFHYYETLILFILGFFILFTWIPVICNIHQKGFYRKYGIASLVLFSFYLLVGLLTTILICTLVH